MRAREVRADDGSWIAQVVRGGSIFVNGLIGGSGRVTLSAKAGMARANGSRGWAVVAAVIDWLWLKLRREPGHVEDAYLSHVAAGDIVVEG